MKNQITSKIGSELGRVPPQAQEVEEIIIGTLLLESSSYDRIENILKKECFYNDNYSEIFNIISTLHAKQKKIDPFIVSQEINKNKKLENIGDLAFLVSLTNKVASSAHLESHSLIVFEKYLKREVIKIQSESINNSYEDVEDVENVLSKLNSDVEKLNDISVGQINDNKISSITRKCISSLENRNRNHVEGISIGINTGITKLNDTTAGWQNGELIILAARPGQGKTALMNHFAKCAEVPAVIFSLEMADIQLVDRFIVGASGIDPQKYKTGNLDDSDWILIEKGHRDIEKLPIIIDQTPRVTVQNIRNSARRLHKKGKCRIIFIDYLQLITSYNNTNPNEKISEITRELKLLAKELDVPIILLSQLNRKVEERPNKRPQLSDLRDSGAIEQDADMVMFVYRPSYYDLKGPNDEDLTGQGKLIIGKFRNGSTSDILFYHNESLTKIMNEKDDTNLPF